MAQSSRSAEGRIAAAGARGMPLLARLALAAGLGCLLAGAAYLLAVRGEALILDLAAFSQRIFCF
jgi:hypothetical protein